MGRCLECQNKDEYCRCGGNPARALGYALDECDDLTAENKRLRELISAEASRSMIETGWCPFCDKHDHPDGDCPKLDSESAS